MTCQFTGGSRKTGLLACLRAQMISQPPAAIRNYSYAVRNRLVSRSMTPQSTGPIQSDSIFSSKDEPERGGGGGRELSLLSDDFLMPDADQTGGPSRPQTTMGFSFLGRFWFFGFFTPGTGHAADRRPTAGASCKLYAVRFDSKLWKSLRLALCIASAASVSDWI